MTEVNRSHYCGQLSSSDTGAKVVVCGWVHNRREHGEKLAFIDLRDHTGVLQCVVDEKLNLRSEFVVCIKGTIAERPEGTANPSLPTGEIELTQCEVEVLSAAEPAPIPVGDRVEVDESLRLRYRYVDLRSEKMQENLRTRARVNSALRRSMEDMGFLELETPMLIASTPEGARDFVVPSRLYKGSFYALPQSPQIFKQLSMLGGIDRYYQIARCLRDEDLRADRQFEFMQLDLEASFAAESDIIHFVSTAVKAGTATALGGEKKDGRDFGDFQNIKFQTITYQEAMEKYGSDKPDTRFELHLADVSKIFTKTEARVFQAECIKAINLKQGSEATTRAQIDELTDFSKKLGASGLAWFKATEDGGLDGPLAKFLSQTETGDLLSALSASSQDLILAVADKRATANKVLGQVRLRLGAPKNEKPQDLSDLHFVWVVDFPLFEGIDQEGNPIPAHHLFTMPSIEDIDLLVRGGGEGMLAIRSQAYDLVLNGWELGSGSIRISNPDIQQRVFAALGMSEAEAQEKFGYLLEAYKYGAPPHGGFAMGIDRFVAILLGEENIREVIAFPKTQSGHDPLTSAPGRISPVHLAELGIQVLEEEPEVKT